MKRLSGWSLFEYGMVFRTPQMKPMTQPIRVPISARIRVFRMPLK